MAFRMIQKLSGRALAWFDSKTAEIVMKPLPSTFKRQARLALENLEVRSVPAAFMVLNDADAGAGSLRQAVLDANGLGGPDTIIFDPNFFSTARTITLASTISISDAVSINGPGVNLVTVSGNSAVRIFDTSTAAAGIDVKLRDFSLIAGSAAGGGGAILIGDEAVTLERTIVQDNTVSGAGGAIHLDLDGASLSLIDSKLTGNKAGGDGGAIDMYGVGSVTITRSTISGNVAGSNGGAIYVFDSGSIDISDSTLSGNTSTGTGSGGGAIYFWGTTTGSGFNVTNSTFSGNSTAASGGAIVLNVFSGVATIRNSTLTGNTSGTSSVTAGYGGGAISQRSGAGVLTLVSTVVTGNTSNGANGRDDVAAVTPVVANFSAIFDADGFTFDPGSSDNLASGTDYKLSATLKNNGGSTLTHAINPLSPLVDKGSNPLGLAKDQTGLTDRAVDGGSGSPTPDIGAVEFVAGDPVASGSGFVTVTADLPGINNPYTFTVTYSDVVDLLSSTIGDAPDVEVVRVGGGFSTDATFVSASPGTNAPSIVAMYKFNPPGGSWDAADDGVYKVNMLASAVKSTSGKFVPAGMIGSFRVEYPITYVVTNDLDSGPGSFSEAVNFANFHKGKDVILFDAAFFSSAKTIPVSSGITITDNVTIDGPGATKATLMGVAPGYNLLTIANASPAGLVTIRGLTLSGGSASSSGGAIRATSGSLTIETSTISGNIAPGGGGVYMNGLGTLTIDRSTVSGNSANNSHGGGIRAETNVSVVILDSTISGNTSSGSNFGGGGIQSSGAPSLLISNSTISNNSTSGSGSAVGLIASPNANIRNSTITGNTSSIGFSYAGDAGAVSLYYNTSGNLNVSSSIISGNVHTYSGPPGGAQEDLSISANATATVATTYYSDDAGGTFADGGGNIQGSFVNLNLGLLADNGGPTMTHALGAGSAAIDKGDNIAPPLAKDQTGLTARVVNGGTSATADMGSFEFTPGSSTTVMDISVNGGAIQRSRVTEIIVTFSGAVSPSGFSGVGDIKLTRYVSTPSGTVGTIVQTGATGANGLITVSQPGPTNQLALTFSNADASSVTDGVEYQSLSDGRWELTIPSAGSYASGQPFAPSPPVIHRLFGDIDGNTTVDGTDFGFFPPFGAVVNNPFDWDNNSDFGGGDFGEFGNRFGLTL